MLGRLVLAALVAAPLAAIADPSPPVGASSPSQPPAAAPGRFAPVFKAPPPALLFFEAPDGGLGLRLMRGGQPVSLSELGRSGGKPLEMEAGYLWKGEGSEAVLGYSQFDLGPPAPTRAAAAGSPFRPQSSHARGVLGLGFTLHTK